MRLSRIRIAAGLCAAIVLAGSLIPAIATAWTIEKATNGVRVVRESLDTSAAAEVFVYYDYRSGDVSWDDTYSPTVTSSYRENTRYRFALAANYGTSIEIPLEPDYRLQLVYVRQSVSPNAPLGTFAVINEPVRVQEINPIESVAIEGAVSIEATDHAWPVSIETTPVPVDVRSVVSVESTVTTIPVSVADLGGVDSAPLATLSVVVAGFAVGLALWRGRRA